MKRVVIYFRLATKGKESIENHKVVLEQYAKARNLDIVGIYLDEGKSGTKIESRRGLQELLNNLPKDKFDLILVKSLPTLSRNLEGLNDIVNQVKQHNKDILVMDSEQYLSNNSTNDFNVQSKIIATRIKKAILPK